MASTFSALLRLELQATGENNNTWGTKNNTVIELIENAISKRQTLSVTSADVTLTTNNGSDDQSRSLCLAASGTLTGNRSIIVPSLSKLYLVTNDCTGAFTLTVKTLAGTGIVIPQGGAYVVYCDGTNVIAFNRYDAIEIGAASDTTLTRSAAGIIAIEGNPVPILSSLASSNTIAGGTYTPTITEVSEIDSSTGRLSFYTRIGNTVHVQGRVMINGSGGGSFTAGISLPVASNLGADTDLSGSANTVGSSDYFALTIVGDVANNRATLFGGLMTTTGGNQEFHFSFSYRVL